MAWGFVKSASNSTSNAGTLTATFASPTTAGNVVIAYVNQMTGAPNPATITGVADGNGVALYQVAYQNQQVGYTNGIWAYQVPAGTTTITATLGQSTNGTAILVQEFSGLLAPPFNFADGTPGLFTFSTASSGGPAFVSPVANDLLVSVWVDQGVSLSVTPPTTSGGGQTLTADTHNINASGNSDLLVVYGNTSGGTDTVTWNWGSTSDFGNVITVGLRLAGFQVKPPQAYIPAPAFQASGPPRTRPGPANLGALPAFRPLPTVVTGGPRISGPNYAGAASDLGGGTGSWVNPTNADGPPDGSVATWTAP